MIIIDDIKNGKKGEQFNAGSKARADIDTILKKDLILFLDNSENKTILSRTLTFFSSYRKIKKLKKNEIVVIQYPLYIINKFRDILYKGLKDKKTIALIHDINSLRQYSYDTQKHQQEINVLNQFDIVIAHNNKMKEWLIQNGLQAKVITLELFDYLADPIKAKEIKYDISFAGNLHIDKSKFLYEAINANPDVSFELFGVGLDQGLLKSTNAHYQGSKNPEELIQSIHAKYGLIWDGDTINTCSGKCGYYERFNNPHKLSMNIAAECPVIVWKEAAIADFVQKHQIGLCVDSLFNIKEKLQSISDQEYLDMVNNIQVLSEKVRNGHYTKEAIELAINELRAPTF